MPMNLIAPDVSNCYTTRQIVEVKESPWRALPILIPVEDRREHLVHVGGCADEKEDDEEERLEVEEGRLVCRETS
jgi:hypothetical protein